MTLKDAIRKAEKFACKYISRMRHRADILQSVRVTAWNVWQKKSGDVSDKYLFSATRNCVYTEYRKHTREEANYRRHRRSLMKYYEGLRTEKPPDTMLEMMDLLEGSLVGTQREIFVMLRRGDTKQEISDKLDLRLSSVKNYISRTITQARKLGRICRFNG